VIEELDHDVDGELGCHGYGHGGSIAEPVTPLIPVPPAHTEGT
jgi:hypothetical protein